MTQPDQPDRVPSSKTTYARIWRWHFYAGLYVAPFVLMLAITGLVMLTAPALEDRLYADRHFVAAPGPAATSIEQQIESVRLAFPERTITHVTPAVDPARATQVITDEAGALATVYVDPTTGRVMGEVADTERPRVIATLVHSTLLVGAVGDWLIETAAGLGIVLVASGVVLWWPRERSWLRAFSVARAPRRLVARDIHRVVGIVVAPVLVFYLLTGLAWTGVWGERFTQAWSTFPPDLAAPSGAAGGNAHASAASGATLGDVLNTPGRTWAPWGAEQLPMPISIVARQHEGHGGQADHGMPALPTVSADEAVTIARVHGIGDGHVIRLPAGAEGVWTISATGMSGLITNPRDEVTVHVDQYSGDVRGVVTWADYSLPAKAMASGVPLHQGSLGGWNVLASALVCLAMIGLSAAGVLAWWWRRPSRAWRLGAPPLPAGVGVPRAVIVAAVLVGLAFPLVGLTFVVVALVDRFVVERVPSLRAVFD